MKKYIPIAVFTIAAILWISFIWSNSGESAEVSSEKSSQVQEIVNEVAESVGIEEPISEHTIRKTAHFGEYAILGLILAADALSISNLFKKRTLLSVLTKISSALLISFFVALIDEFVVQGNTEGRGPQFTDVIIDMSGALLGTCGIAIIFAIVFFTLKRRKEKRSYNAV